MLYAEYVPEHELEATVRRQVADIKFHSAWEDPTKLCKELRLTLHIESLGTNWEGAALDNTVAANSKSRRTRQLFTIYHEIVHVLIRRNDQLYSTLHDQYSSEQDFERIVERLCNVGAAEFLIPRDTVRHAIENSGFSLSLLPELMAESTASPTAICMALGLYAQHRCVAIVGRWAPTKECQTPHLFVQAVTTEPALQVEAAASSRTMTSVVARGSIIPRTHLLYATLQSDEGHVRRGAAPIPFRMNHTWIVDCEALRIGNQVFGLCHADPPPAHSPGQLRLL